MKNFRSKLNRGKRLTVGDPSAVDDSAPSQPRADSFPGTVDTGRPEVASGTSTPRNEPAPAPEDDVQETPEAAAQRLVRLFCMGQPDDGEAEVVLLPSIVDAAESSPQAAAECARYIRKFMYREYWNRPSVVYNAITLMRILVANPATSFTRSMDKKFVDTVRDVLRNGNTSHVVHFLIETLREFESMSVVDEGMGRMLEMWQKEEAKSQKVHAKLLEKSNGRPSFWSRQQEQSRLHHQQQQGYQAAPPHQQQYYAQQQPQQPALMSGPMPVPMAMPIAQPVQQWMPPHGGWGPYPQQQQQQQSQAHGSHDRGGRGSGRSGATLPKPRDLRKRLEEARTTAGVLADVVNTTTSPDALLRHDLVYDLCARCTRASTQVLEYLMTANPLPDNDEMAALLATQEVLHQSLQHFHRAVLDARRGLGIAEERRAADGSNPAEMTSAVGAGKGKAAAPQSPGVVGDGPGEEGSGSGSGGRNGHRNNGRGRASHGGGGHDRDEDAHDDYDDYDDDYDRNDRAAAQKEEEEMLAAAIAASTASGASGRGKGRAGGGGGGGGGAAGGAGGSGAAGSSYAYGTGSEAAENPFGDSAQGPSSRSSSVARPWHGGGGGGSARPYAEDDNASDDEYQQWQRSRKSTAKAPSALATGAGAGAGGSGNGSGIAYVDSDNPSDEEYLQWQRSRKKNTAKAPWSADAATPRSGGSAVAGASSAAAGGGSGSASSGTATPPRPEAGGSAYLPSRPVLDAAASSSSGVPIYRY